MKKKICKELPELVFKNDKFLEFNHNSKFISVYLLLCCIFTPFYFFGAIVLSFIISIFIVSTSLFLYHLVKEKEKNNKRVNVEIKRLIKQIENRDYGLVSLLDESIENFEIIHDNLPYEEREQLNEIYQLLKSNKFYSLNNYYKYIDLLKYFHFLLDIGEGKSYTGDLITKRNNFERKINNVVIKQNNYIKKEPKIVLPQENSKYNEYMEIYAKQQRDKRSGADVKRRKAIQLLVNKDCIRIKE